jgi:hypothetical protein
MPENGSFEPVCSLGWNSYGTSGDITTTAKEQMDILKVEFPPILDRVKKAGLDLQNLDKQLDAIKAPWTPEEYLFYKE